MPTLSSFHNFISLVKLTSHYQKRYAICSVSFLLLEVHSDIALCGFTYLIIKSGEVFLSGLGIQSLCNCKLIMKNMECNHVL